MIKELVELAERIPKEGISHDSLDFVPVSIECVIDKEGNFKKFITHEKQPSLCERIAAKKGKARLLVDKAEEVLEFVDESITDIEELEKTKSNSKFKHDLFMQKINNYSELNELKPVLLFYETNKINGVGRARELFPTEVDEKQRSGNIAFLLIGENRRLHEQDNIYKGIISSFEKSMLILIENRFEKCSICGSSSYPIADLPHGPIKQVPKGQSAGCALVSYNFTAAESYGLKGNENSSLCTHCSRAYVDSLNWLLSNSTTKKNDKGKEVFVYKNRKKISEDTAVLFWLRKADETSILDILDNPTEENIHSLFDSVYSGSKTSATKLDADTFYSLTVSGVKARITVRDWIETSLDNLQSNLVQWFQDIEITKYDSNEKNISKYYPRFNSLVLSAKSKSDSTVQHGRIGAVLWKSAVLGFSPPLWLLNSILNRIRAEQSEKPPEGKKMSQWDYKLPERIALLKLYLNRINKQNKRNNIMTELDEANKNTAYICGRIFAVLESIQYFASGGNLNAGIRERFFSFASTMPSTAFGRLMKLTQHHLSKISGEKPGLAVDFDKKLQDLICKLEGNCFPTVFSLEDQACFAIGYYHQKQKEFSNKSNK